ncbi:ParA family protein [Pseudomonas sp. NPDC087803]|uniref:ParA family protein n=1 Tax=Pseudomonas sp. NPDC087803 TaxID=3364448 RepID=UPI0037FB2194
MQSIAIFNNKGGVGKTTYIYHVAHLLAEKGKKVLLVDCDSQSNLTAYCLDDKKISDAWSEKGNSIYRGIELVYRGIGDIRSEVEPIKVGNSLYLVPGDIRLSNFEDALGDTWNSAKGGSEPSIRAQSAIYRFSKLMAEKINADVIMYDLGPNLGALNRAVLGASDYFITPVAPDLFSIQGTENLGSKFESWRQGWAQCNSSWKGDEIEIPKGMPIFLGYVVQRHNIRDNKEGMTQGWQIYADQIDGAIVKNIIKKLEESGQVYTWPDGFNLGKIPNLHSLIPYSLAARKPVFNCTRRDGLNGAHISRARESKNHFTPIVNRLLKVI